MRAIVVNAGRMLVALLGLSCACGCAARWLEGEADAPAERVLLAAQASERFAGFMAIVAAGHERQAAALPPPAAERFAVAARRAYDPARRYPEFTAAFTREFPAGDAAAVIAWLDSPVGRRVAAAELDALRPEAAAGFRDFLPAALALPETRKALVREYLDATMAEAHARLLVVLPLHTFATVLRGAVPSAGSGDPVEDERRQVELEQQAVGEYLALMPASTAYVFRALDDADFRNMLDFCRSAAGAAFIRAYLAGIGAALEAASAELGAAGAAMIDERTASGQTVSPQP